MGEQPGNRLPAWIVASCKRTATACSRTLRPQSEIACGRSVFCSQRCEGFHRSGLRCLPMTVVTFDFALCNLGM